MRLEVRQTHCGTNVFLSIKADSRDSLARGLGGRSVRFACPHCAQEEAHDVNAVYARPGPSVTIAAGTVLAAVGLAAGSWPGFLIGGVVGALAGLAWDSSERLASLRWNAEVVP